MKAFVARLGHSAMALLKALDILLCAIWLGALYPFGLASRPTGRQFVSTYVGGAAINGNRWALVVEKVIDKVFYWLGDGPNHCRRAYLTYNLLDE